MANLRVFYDNLWKRSTSALTATSAASALPAAASQNPQRTYIWRSLQQTGTQALDLDLGSVQAVTSVAAANVRLLTGGVLKLQHRGDATSPGVAVDVVTLPTQDTDARTAGAVFATQSHRHWRLLWTNPSAVSEYAEVGYVHLGTYWEATVNFSVPSENGFSDPSVSSPSLDGQEDYAARTGVHSARLRFAYLSESQRADLRTIYRAIGRRTPAFFWLDPALAWTLWLARFDSDLVHPFEVPSAKFNMVLSVREAR